MILQLPIIVSHVCDVIEVLYHASISLKKVLLLASYS